MSILLIISFAAILIISSTIELFLNKIKRNALRRSLKALNTFVGIGALFAFGFYMNPTIIEMVLGAAISIAVVSIEMTIKYFTREVTSEGTAA